MLHSIGDVARMAGVSARTLRHYDDLGLLRPARAGTNGYRWYGRAELLRLQRILLLREMNVPLADVREILAGQVDELGFLRAHQHRLAGERARLDRIAATVDRTIADLEGADDLSDEEFFDGLTDRTAALRSTLTARFGSGVEEHFDHAATIVARWTRADHLRAAERGRDLLTRMASVMRDGTATTDPAVVDLVREHHLGVCELWPADAAAYHALADVIEHEPAQRAMVAEVDPALPSWLAARVRAYAITELGYRAPS